MISQGDIAKFSVVIRNTGASSLSVSLLPTCSCLTVDPPSTALKPGDSQKFDLSYDSKDDEGKVSRGYLVKTGDSSSKPLYYLLYGVVRAEKAIPAPSASASGAQGADPAQNGLELRYYYTPGCRSCETFLASKLPALETNYGVKVRLVRRDLLDSSAYDELNAAAQAAGQSLHAIPALKLGNTLLQGDREIESRLPGLLMVSRDGVVPPQTSAVKPLDKLWDSGDARMAVVPVFLAGLVDGVNPCAFTTLVFLLASLTLAGRGRREVLVIGSLFTLAVFLTYFGIGLGLFAALRAASGIAFVSLLLRWILVAVLLVFALLSVYDYFKIRAGKTSEIILQLPNSLKLKIHASIRTRAKTAAIAGSSLMLGFLVSIFEFACTGQVYLPMLAYAARQPGRTGGLGLLALYNLAFIAPLLAVFAASYFGVSSKRIATAFQKRLGAVKLALAAVFLVLALLTLLS